MTACNRPASVAAPLSACEKELMGVTLLITRRPEMSDSVGRPRRAIAVNAGWKAVAIAGTTMRIGPELRGYRRGVYGMAR